MSEEVSIGITEIEQALTALGTLATAASKIMQDGKINAKDLGAVIELAKKSDELLEGFKGLDKALEEAKNIDQEEAIQIVVKVISIVKAVKAASKSDS